MNYHIETISVWDAFKEESECPFCSIEQSLEQQYISSYLGDAAMLPEVRVEVNKTGFCGKHFLGLYEAQVRLPLALQLHTYMLEQNKKNTHLLNNFQKKCNSVGGAAKIVGLKPAALKDDLAKLKEQIEKMRSSCLICSKIENNMNRYMDTAVKLYSDDSEFKQLFHTQRGFCMPHFYKILEAAYANYPLGKFNAFTSELIKMQTENLNRIADEVEWFTKKFDYQNKEKPWGNSKDSLSRAINKLKGRTIYSSSNKLT